VAPHNRLTVKALLLSDYDRLDYVDVPEPELGAGEALIRVMACGICGSDVHGIDGRTGRRIPPLIMGHEAAGVIAELQGEASEWRIGDRVTFDSTISCGHCGYCERGQLNLCDNRRVFGVSCEEFRQHGAFAEYVAVPVRILHRLPDTIAFAEGAMVEPLSIAAHAIERGPAGPVETAVVIGAGTIGLLLVQVLKARGCGNIVAVGRNPSRLDQARRMGADLTLRSDLDDVAAKINEITSGRGADVAYEAVGIGATFELATRIPRKRGSLVLVGNLEPIVGLPLQSVVTRELSLVGSAASAGEYPASIEMIARRRVDVAALISAVAPLGEGASWFDRLRQGEEGVLKVILEP
jgi:L-iditol 2-dehydrogenase